MHRVRIITSSKPLWILSNKTVSCYGTTTLSTVVTPSFGLSPQHQTARSIHLASPNYTVATAKLQPSLFKRFLRKIGVPTLGKYKRIMSGYLLYEDITANINYVNFFTHFKMANTFYSWFVITELHVWMLMIRFMAEGKVGQEFRNNIVEAMWSDVNARKSQLKNANVIAAKTQVVELSQQFNAAIMGYDEGIMSDDKILAGALWRRFFQCECNNPELLEMLVAYIRKQVHELDKLPSEKVLTMRSTAWLDFRNP